MRIRTIRPEFYQSESVGSMTWKTRLIFINLWSYVEDNGVNLDSYNRKITFQHLTEEGIRNIGDAVVTMAENEQLEAHANAIR